MKMIIGVVGNCQAREVAKSLRRHFTDIDVRGYFMGSEHDNASLQAQAEEIDFCISIDIPSPYGFMATENLSKSVKNLIQMPQITFTGLHPDITYVKSGNKNFKSPIGSYHSKIIVASFLNGLSVSRTESLFNRYIYKKLGYIDEFKSALFVLNKKVESTGFEIDMENLVRSSFMHTINHPTGKTISLIAKEAARKIGLDVSSWDYDVDIAADGLSADTVWRVYPEIAQSIGLPEGPLVFKPENLLARFTEEKIGLREFIETSFDLYSNNTFDHSPAAETRRILKDQMY